MDVLPCGDEPTLFRTRDGHLMPEAVRLDRIYSVAYVAWCAAHGWVTIDREVYVKLEGSS